MSFILKLLGEAPAPSRNPDDDRWWGEAATQSVAGTYVDADTAMKLSAVWACVKLLSETIASLPLVVYKNLDDGGKERATNHPIYRLIHDSPNETQTAFEFWEMMLGHALLRGNAYAKIIPGPRGFADQLKPVHPDKVTVEKLKNGRLRYQIMGDDGQKQPFNQDDIFHLRGLSFDGVVGVSVIAYARDSLGMAQAAEGYGSRYFRNDSRPGGILRTDKKLSKPAAGRLKQSWEAAHTGGNQHRVAVLEEGLEWQQIGISPQDSQFLETREFQAEDVCRWFGVPAHMVNLSSKATSWGSGIEQLGIGFVTYTLLPWLTRTRQAIGRDLILVNSLYFADFVVEGLLRGNINDRYKAYATGIQWGWISPNEVRKLENMNPRPDGDAYLTPLNMVRNDERGMQNAAIAPTPALPQGEKENAHYRMLAEEAAGRLMRKEVAAMTRVHDRCSSAHDWSDWETAVRDFYDSHADLVAQTMQISKQQAMAYCTVQANVLVTLGLAAFVPWAEERVTGLASMAIAFTQPSPEGRRNLDL